MLREILRPRPHIIGRRLLIIVIRDMGASCAARSFGVLSAAAVVELGGIRGIIRSQLIVPALVVVATGDEEGRVKAAGGGMVGGRGVATLAPLARLGLLLLFASLSPRRLLRPKLRHRCPDDDDDDDRVLGTRWTWRRRIFMEIGPRGVVSFQHSM